MNSISKNMYTDKLDYIVSKYNHTYHSSIKMKPIDVKSSTYIDFDKNNNKEDPKFEVGDHVKISKYKNIFAKGFVPNCSEEVFLITKVENTVPWTYVISDLNGEEIFGTFYEKELQKTNQKEFRIESVMINYMPNGIIVIIQLIVVLIKKILLYKNELFSTV